MEEGAVEVRRTAKRRFHKTDCLIKRSEKIILVGNREETMEELVLFLTQFADIYQGKQITLINIRHNADAVLEQYTNKLNDKLDIVEFVINDINEKGIKWLGNEQKWKQIMRFFRLSDDGFWLKLLEARRASRKIIIYGGGVYGAQIINLLKHWSIDIWSVAVTERAGNVSSLEEIPLKSIYELQEYKDQSTVIISVKSIQFRLGIRSLLEELHFTDIIDYNETLLDE